MKKQAKDKIVLILDFDGTFYSGDQAFSKLKAFVDSERRNFLPKLTNKEYYVRGCTALLDAVGGAIHHIVNVHKYAREEDRPEKTLFIITTDGIENASKYYSYEDVQAMIKKEQEKYGWEFIFIGANMDAVQEAKRFGIRKERAVNYVHDEIGTETVYRSVSKAVCAMRMADASCVSSVMDECDWKDDINIDYNRRNGKKGDRR